MSDYYILLQVFLSTLSLISVMCQICVIQSSTCQKNLRTLMFSFSILSNFLHVLVIGFFVTQKTDIPHIILAVLSILTGTLQMLVLNCVVSKKSSRNVLLEQLPV